MNYEELATLLKQLDITGQQQQGNITGTQPQPHQGVVSASQQIPQGLAAPATLGLPQNAILLDKTGKPQQPQQQGLLQQPFVTQQQPQQMAQRVQPQPQPQQQPTLASHLAYQASQRQQQQAVIAQQQQQQQQVVWQQQAVLAAPQTQQAQPQMLTQQQQQQLLMAQLQQQQQQQQQAQQQQLLQQAALSGQQPQMVQQQQLLMAQPPQQQFQQPQQQQFQPAQFQQPQQQQFQQQQQQQHAVFQQPVQQLVQQAIPGQQPQQQQFMQVAQLPNGQFYVYPQQPQQQQQQAQPALLSSQQAGMVQAQRQQAVQAQFAAAQPFKQQGMPQQQQQQQQMYQPVQYVQQVGPNGQVQLVQLASPAGYGVQQQVPPGFQLMQVAPNMTGQQMAVMPQQMQQYHPQAIAAVQQQQQQQFAAQQLAARARPMGGNPQQPTIPANRPAVGSVATSFPASSGQPQGKAFPATGHGGHVHSGDGGEGDTKLNPKAEPFVPGKVELLSSPTAPPGDAPEPTAANNTNSADYISPSCIIKTAEGKTVYRCPQCDESNFITDAVLRSHLRAKHNVTNTASKPDPVRCNFSPEQLSRLQAVVATFISDVCGGGSGSVKQLQQQLATEVPPVVLEGPLEAALVAAGFHVFSDHPAGSSPSDEPTEARVALAVPGPAAGDAPAP